MRQHHDRYTSEDFEVWKILFDRQAENLQDKATPRYLECLEEMKDVLHGDKVPDFRELDEVLKAKTGWTIEVVPGLIPVGDFFELLSRKRFCSSTWLRQKSQLDYLEEPDMFHDIFGHIPFFMDEDYANFVQQIGRLGVAFSKHPTLITQLERFYWFTIEFGLMQQNGLKIYGAGIISSFGESNHIYTDAMTIEPFELDRILNMNFTKSEIQNRYFTINGLGDLYAMPAKLEKVFSETVKQGNPLEG